MDTDYCETVWEAESGWWRITRHPRRPDRLTLLHGNIDAFGQVYWLPLDGVSPSTVAELAGLVLRGREQAAAQ